MLNRKTIATALVIASAAVSAPAFATGDAGVNHAARLLEEARSFGKSSVQGASAGAISRERAERRETEPKSVNEQRWEQVRKAQSLN